MQIKTIKTDRIINKITTKDSLFHGNYTVDPYQNCDFGCIYCDSSYNTEVLVKINAVELLDEELKNLEKGRIIIGSVHDPYQKAEEEYKLTRGIIELIKNYGFACHILTKSELVLRDLDLLKQIKECMVTVSITSADEKVSKVFEKNVSSPKKRMQVVEKLRQLDITAGLAIMPAIPYIIEESIEKIVENAKKYNAGYLLFKHLELKGDQKTIFFDVIKNHYPEHYPKLVELYKERYSPDESYLNNLNKKIKSISFEKGIKNTIY